MTTTDTPRPPASGAEGNTLTAEQIAAIEHLHTISDSHDRWDSTPLLIADLRAARAENAALRDRLARAEGREGELRLALKLLGSLWQNVEMGFDTAENWYTTMRDAVGDVVTGIALAPTDGAAPQRAADDEGGSE